MALPELKSRPLMLADSQQVRLSLPHCVSHRAGVTQSMLRKALILTLIEYSPQQQERQANCNYRIINAFCILQ